MVFIGTYVSGRTQDCVIFCFSCSLVMPTIGPRLAKSPASLRICPGITPTCVASAKVASSVPSRATIRPRVVGSRVMRTRRPGISWGRMASGPQSMRQRASCFSPSSTRWSSVSRENSPRRSVR